MGPEIRTSFVAEIGAGDSDGHAQQARAVVLRAGAVDVDVDVEAGADEGDAPDRRTVSALFHNVGDSIRATVELVRTLPATARIALYTGAAVGDVPAAAHRERARQLLAQAEPGEILTTTPTAVMAGGALPPGTELLDRGPLVLGDQAPERCYEFVVHRREDRWADDAGASNLEWARRAVDGPVVGVDDHLATLEDAWKKAIDGKRCMITVSGHAGVGKTTLIAELALRVHAEGALVLYGRWDRDVTAPYQAFREALGVYADGCSTERLRADLEGWGDEIARLLPDVGARVGGLQPAVPTPYDERSRLLEAVEAWFRALTRRTPTLLVLDDVHWAEPESFCLLDHLHLTSAGVPLLILVTVSEDLMSAEMVDAFENCPAELAGLETGEVDRIHLEGR
jgi:AAA ATPase domain